MTKAKNSVNEISEESTYYRIKMARYYEEEWDKLFKTKNKTTQKDILYNPKSRVSKLFAKDVIKAAERRDWDDDHNE